MEAPKIDEALKEQLQKDFDEFDLAALLGDESNESQPYTVK